jgi:hypothetical protein
MMGGESRFSMIIDVFIGSFKFGHKNKPSRCLLKTWRIFYKNDK